jgi:hypothetical protein
MEAYGATLSSPVIRSTKAMVESQNLDHVNREGIILETTKDTITPWVLHEGLENTGTLKTPDQLLEQEHSNRIPIGRFDEVPCSSEESGGDHHCEQPECRQSFPTRRALL